MIPEKHRKFAAYHKEIGEPPLECRYKKGTWEKADGSHILWTECFEYRIAGDRHWLLRKKWVDSGKTLPIEYKSSIDDEWIVVSPTWEQEGEYREAVEKHEDTCTDPAEEKTYVDHLGDSFIALGNALKDRNTNIADLADLAGECGLDIQFRIVAT